MKRTLAATVQTAIFALWTLTAFGAVPQLINFQGILKDGSGSPVADGSYSVTFKIYDAPTGGNVLWNETQSVNSTNGLFTVLLGAVSPVPDSAFNDSSRYLAIQVAPDPEMSPRQKLVSVPFATGNWSATGNGGTEPGRNFLGTTDNQALELKVNGLRALRIEPTASDTGSNWLAGFSSNRAYPGVQGATIGGGGYLFNGNRVSDNFAAIGGGANNVAGNQAGTTTDAVYATVGGGLGNKAGGSFSAVPGGRQNFADGDYSFAAGRRAQANHAGTFVWADTGDAILGTDFVSTAPNQFLIRASGGVGIGINAPTARLQVGLVGSEGTPPFIAGTMVAAQASDPGNWAHMAIISSAFGQSRLNFGDGANDDQGSVAYDNVADAMFLRTAAAERMRITSTGNVGIGTNNPLGLLHLNGGNYKMLLESSGNADLVIGRADATRYGNFILADGNPSIGANNRWAIGLRNGDSKLHVYDEQNSSNVMVLEQGGKVGIGTATPQGALDVNSTTGAFIVPRMTTAQRNALTPVNGMIIYNTDAVAGGRFEFRENGAWVTK